MRPRASRSGSFWTAGWSTSKKKPTSVASPQLRSCAMTLITLGGWLTACEAATDFVQLECFFSDVVTNSDGVKVWGKESLGALFGCDLFDFSKNEHEMKTNSVTGRLHSPDGLSLFFQGFATAWSVRCDVWFVTKEMVIDASRSLLSGLRACNG